MAGIIVRFAMGMNTLIVVFPLTRLKICMTSDSPETPTMQGLVAVFSSSYYVYETVLMINRRGTTAEGFSKSISSGPL